MLTRFFPPSFFLNFYVNFYVLIPFQIFHSPTVHAANGTAATGTGAIRNPQAAEISHFIDFPKLLYLSKLQTSSVLIYTTANSRPRDFSSPFCTTVADIDRLL